MKLEIRKIASEEEIVKNKKQLLIKLPLLINNNLTYQIRS